MKCRVVIFSFVGLAHNISMFQPNHQLRGQRGCSSNGSIVRIEMVSVAEQFLDAGTGFHERDMGMDQYQRAILSNQH